MLCAQPLWGLTAQSPSQSCRRSFYAGSNSSVLTWKCDCRSRGKHRDIFHFASAPSALVTDSKDQYRELSTPSASAHPGQSTAKGSLNTPAHPRVCTAHCRAQKAGRALLCPQQRGQKSVVTQQDSSTPTILPPAPDGAVCRQVRTEFTPVPSATSSPHSSARIHSSWLPESCCTAGSKMEKHN